MDRAPGHSCPQTLSKMQVQYTRIGATWSHHSGSSGPPLCSQLSLSIKRRSEFVRETFALGGQQKRSVLSQTILDRDTYRDDFPNDPQPPLFPNRCSLYLLLRDLADLFRNHYWKPEPADWWTLATVEKFMGDVMHDIRENLPAYRYQQFQKGLQDHRYTIGCFARHLQGNDWPHLIVLSIVTVITAVKGYIRSRGDREVHCGRDVRRHVHMQVTTIIIHADCFDQTVG